MLRVRILTVLVLVAGLLAGGCSSAESPASDPEAQSEAETEASEPALFDGTVVHEIDLTYDTHAYDEMLATFADSGEKTWIEATATIDGVTYEQVGLRLKGNSSLMGLRGGAEAPGDGDGNGDDGAEADGDTQDPNELPWLIRLDEFVDGQDHQGYEDVVVRSNSSATALNEAVALDLLDAANLASQEAASTSFSVNGTAPVLRLAIEHPDDDAWQETNFSHDGALYKAESTGDWSYRGDDPELYEEVFDQEGGSDLTDLAPLIDFLEFVNESDDETFAAELPERLDTDAFATYLAMMELVDNFDDIDGPGNNAYLWYDLTTEQFTVVPWDMNLAFGTGIGPGGAGGPGGFDPSQLPDGAELPDGFEPPEGFDPGQLPDGAELPEGLDAGDLLDSGGGSPAGLPGRSNVLVERFHENEEFEALYEMKLGTLRIALYGSDVATEILEARVETLTRSAADLVDEDTVKEEADAIAAQFSS